MSGWDAYISSLMQQSQAIKKAAIVAAADGGIWARSEDPAFSVSFPKYICPLLALNEVNYIALLNFGT